MVDTKSYRKHIVFNLKVFSVNRIRASTHPLYIQEFLLYIKWSKNWLNMHLVTTFSLTPPKTCHAFNSGIVGMGWVVVVNICVCVKSNIITNKTNFSIFYALIEPLWIGEGWWSKNVAFITKSCNKSNNLQ